MLHRTLPLATLMIVSLMGCTLTAQSASNASASGATPQKIIAFRLPEWKTAHFHDEARADQAEQTLTEIGCEVTRFAHDGHTDLRYRCQTWKQVALESDERVIQWNQWLIKQGMLTTVVDPAPHVKLSRVAYQLSETRTLHIHDAEEAKYTQDVLEMLGCQVSRSEHNGQIDLQFTCPEWKTIGCNGCPTAHGWQDWLKQQGFATKHSH